MPDVSAKIKGLNVEFNDNLTTSPNIDSGDDIKTSFARIHKRFSQMKSAAYIDASISNNKTITLGDSNIGVVSISQNQGLTDIEKTNARTNIGAGTSNFSGSFNDLTDKPTTIAGYGITDAFSGSFTDLTNKPTTISGYGITDAKIQNGTITLGGNTITPITSFSSLDSPLVGGSGKYISSISETDGIISATETTLDTVPTENSTNAITSGAVYTDSTNQQLEINYAINTGVKNLLDYTFSINGNTSARTSNGVTFTINADGSISTSGTASANVTSAWIQMDYVVPSDPVILSGCPAGGAYDTYRIDILDGTPTGTVVAFDYGNGVVIKSSMFTSGIGIIRIRIEKGQNVDGLVFKPMIRPASITDSTFVPYAKTNRELYETKTEQTETNTIANLGAKNLLNFDTRSAASTGGVSYTVNADGTITVNGTPQGTGPSYVQLMLRNDAVRVDDFCDGSHILSGCPSGGSDSSYKLYVAKGSYSRVDYGNGVLLTDTTLTDIRVVLYIANGYTANNLVFKPMIRRAEITDSTYVPYAPTNRELYELCETKASLNDIYGIKNQLPNGTDLNNLSAGIMMCPGATVAATLINCPTTTNAFIIYTDYLATTSRAIQRIYSFSTTTGIPAQYMRVRWSQGWTPWYQVMMQQVASASTQSVNQVSTLNLSRNDLDESLDTGFEPLDSITEKESESYNTDEELTEEQSE